MRAGRPSIEAMERLLKSLAEQRRSERGGRLGMAFGREEEDAGAMRADIVPGATFPDFELTDHRGKRRKLSQLQGLDPLILVLSRGSFCPKDRRQMEGLVQLHREMEGGYCRIVTVSTDNRIETNEFRTRVAAHWTFRS